MTADVVFVSCVKSKVDHPAPAKDLYMRSTWFRMARHYAEKNSRDWFILSAAHGLLHSDRVIDPYDISLNWMTVEQRRDWAMLVKRQMDMIGLRGLGTAVVLAGVNYRRHLEMTMLARFAEVEIPMSGLRMGEQLSWLSRNA